MIVKRLVTGLKKAVPLLVITAITLLVYLQGLEGSFLFDDEQNITANERVQVKSLSVEDLWEAAFSANAGPLMRPISMLSFGLNHYFSGLDPFAFKLTNLFIHIVTGIILFFVVRLSLDLYARRNESAPPHPWRRCIALAVTASWLLHPLNLTTVLYVVQRMTGFAALFTLLSILMYLWGRARQFDGRGGLIPIGAALCIGYPLGVLCKENALLLPVFLFLCEWILLGFRGSNSVCRGLTWLYVATVAAPAVLLLSLFLLRLDTILDWYTIRTFTLTERLLTEARVIWFYLALILVPRPSWLGLYHDDIHVSASLFSPATTIVSVLALIALITIAFSCIRRAPILAFGVLFFLSGHLMESTVIPLEIAHEHRNYVPIVGILLSLFYFGLHPAIFEKIRIPRLIGASVFLCATTMITAVRAQTWGDTIEHVLLDAAYHPNSARVNYEAGRVFFILTTNSDKEPARDAYYAKAREYFTRSSKADEANSGGLFAILWLDSVLGKPVDKGTLSSLLARLEDVPMSATNIVSLQNINNCQLGKRCPLSGDIIDNLGNASLRNPTLKGQNRGMVLNTMLIRSLNQARAKDALKLAEAATRADPNTPQHLLNLLDLLIQDSQYEKARRVINALYELNLSRKELGDLADQELLLNKVSQL